MGLARRGFLRALGAVPFAGRSAAQALVQTGVDASGFGSWVSPVQAIEVPTSSAPEAWIVANGLPGFVKDALRQNRRVPRGIDPDLASNRSFSLCTKIRIQRERDLERAVSDTIAQHHISLKKAAFKKATGIELWW